jgi:hypothetical protein
LPAHAKEKKKNFSKLENLGLMITVYIPIVGLSLRESDDQREVVNHVGITQDIDYPAMRHIAKGNKKRRIVNFSTRT